MQRKIYSDIAILADDTLEDLHNAIFNSFGFDGMEVLHSILVTKLGIKRMKSPYLIPVTFLVSKNNELQTLRSFR
jgi:hypothetical protein